MSDADLARIRTDLETMREAAGLELQFGREDVVLSILLSLAGVLLSVWGQFSPWHLVVLGAVPILLVALAAVGLRIAYRRSSGRSAIRRREYTFGLVTGLMVGLLAGVYIAWMSRLGFPRQMVGGAAVFFTGVLSAVLAMSSPGRRSCWASAVALWAYGMLIPVCSNRQVVVLGGICTAIGGLGSAAIQAWQLRSHGRRHEPTAH